MIFIAIFFMLGCGYYTYTYGLYMWKKEKNKVGSVAVILLAILSTLIPAVTLYMQSA